MAGGKYWGGYYRVNFPQIYIRDYDAKKSEEEFQNRVLQAGFKTIPEYMEYVKQRYNQAASCCRGVYYNWQDCIETKGRHNCEAWRNMLLKCNDGKDDFPTEGGASFDRKYLRSEIKKRVEQRARDAGFKTIREYEESLLQRGKQDPNRCKILKFVLDKCVIRHGSDDHICGLYRKRWFEECNPKTGTFYKNKKST